MAQNWEIDPATGDYVMEGGAPKQTDSLRIPAYIRLKARRGAWLYAPDTRWGSDFQNMKQKNTGRLGNQAESIAEKALTPIVEEGRARDIVIESQIDTRGAVGFKTDIISDTGKVEEFTLPPIF